MLRQPTQSDALRERCLEAAAIAAWNIRQLTQSDSLADKSDDYAIGYLSVLLERELYEDGWIIGEDLAEKLAEIAVQTVRQPTQSDALQAENEQLRHDLERQMTIANEHVNEVERLLAALEQIAFSGADGPYGHFGEALNEHQMRRVARAAYHRSKTNV